MKRENSNFKKTGQIHESYFEHMLEGMRFKGNPMFTEYELLFNEFFALKQHVDELDRDKQSLQTQLAEMNRSLDLASRIDPMTGLANRRDIVEKIERELNRSKRHKRTFSLMLLDMDNFKLVNDTHGYNSGDDVLVEVARVLRSCTRNEDICARWGGEDFLFLLTETAIEGALILARKVLESISMTEFKVNHPGIRVTACIGLCEYQKGQSVYDCIAAADQALRQAKRDGKGCFSVADS